MRKNFVIAAFTVSGAAALINEVVWTREFAVVLGGTTHAMSTVVAAFLTGLALGAALGARYLAGRNPVRLLAWIEALIAFTAACTLWSVNNLSPVYARIYYAFAGSPTVFYLLQFCIVFALVLVPTLAMGATFPVALRAAKVRGESAPRDSALLYAANTAGSVAGALLSGFVLIPLLGLHGTAFFAIALHAAVALALAAFAAPGASGVAVAGLVVGLGGLLPQTPAYGFNLYLGQRIASYDAYVRVREAFDVVWEKDDVEGTVQVTQSKTAPRALGLVVQGKPEGGKPTGDRPNQVLMALLPLAYHPEARTFLKIGLGPGVTLNAALLQPSLATIEAVEINAAVIEAVQTYFYPRMATEPRAVFTVADARRHLAYTSSVYDIISSQPSDPGDGAGANLVTREYYELVKSRLAPGGVFVQYVPVGMLGQRGSEIFIKTLASVFPYVYEWDVRQGSNNILAVCSLEPKESDDVITRRLTKLDPHIHGAAAFGAGPERVRKLLARTDVPVATDADNPIEFIVARNYLRP